MSKTTASIAVWSIANTAPFPVTSIHPFLNRRVHQFAMVVRLHIETRRRFAARRRCSVAHAIVRTHGDTHRRDEHRPVRELPAAALAHHRDVVHQRLWLRPTGRRSLWQFCRLYTDSSASLSLIHISEPTRQAEIS